MQYQVRFPAPKKPPVSPKEVKGMADSKLVPVIKIGDVFTVWVAVAVPSVLYNPALLCQIYR